MSFNQRPEHQNLSEQTSNSQASGNETLSNGHDSDYQDRSIQSSSTQTPTTRQPPTLPSIAATSGVPSHPNPFNFGPHYPLNDNDIQASRNGAQAHVNGGRWIARNNNAASPPNWEQMPLNPFGYNPNYPWNNNSARAPSNPHPVVASATRQPAAAGCLPSTFTPGPVSARNQELMDDSTPLETSGQQSGMPNPFDAVGEYRPAYRHWLINQLTDSTARRQARIFDAQTNMSQRRRTNSTGTIIVTEQTSHSEILASLTEASRNGTLPQFIASARADPNTNEESDSPAGVETPDSDDEAELYDCSVNGDTIEQDPNLPTEAVESAEEPVHGSNREAEQGAI